MANPTVTAVSPKSGDNTAIVPITITGTNFVMASAASLILNGTSTTTSLTTTYVSATTLTANVPKDQAAGVYDVKVDNGVGATGTLTGGYVATRPQRSFGAVARRWQFIKSLYPFVSRTTLARPLLQINPLSGGGSILIDGGTLTISDTTNGQQTFDLGANALGDVGGVLSVVGRATVADLYRWLWTLSYQPIILNPSLMNLSALAIIPSESGAPQDLTQNPVLYAWDSPNWLMVTALCDALGKLGYDMDAALYQLNPNTASGLWLDRWGQMFGITRDGGEADTQFRTRLAIHISRPWATPQMLLSMLNDGYGLNATLVQGAPGHFVINYSAIPAGYTEATLLATTRRVCDTYKALGTVYAINIISSLYFADHIEVIVRDVFNHFGLFPPESAGFADHVQIIVTDRFTLTPGDPPPDI